jgi:hypothetical protein
VDARNAAVGASGGVIRMTADQDTTNQALLADSRYAGATLSVPLTTLDGALQGKVPKAIKIDVEGYESAVLAGAAETFADRALEAVIMELNGSGSRYGVDEGRLHQQLCDIGFFPCTYDPLTRRVADLEGQRSNSGNTLYLRSPEAAQLTVVQAPTFRVGGTLL